MSKVFCAVFFCLFVLSTPVLAEDHFYTTGKDNYFHLNDCKTVDYSDVEDVTEAEIMKRGLKPCPVCFLSRESKAVSSDPRKVVKAKNKEEDIENRR